MKFITALILMAVTSTASAGNYGMTVAKQNLCEAYGGIAISMFKKKEKGEPRQVAPLAAESDPVLAYALNYVYDSAPDAKAAYMAAWAKCMDHYE